MPTKETAGAARAPSGAWRPFFGSLFGSGLQPMQIPKQIQFRRGRACKMPWPLNHTIFRSWSPPVILSRAKDPSGFGRADGFFAWLRITISGVCKHPRGLAPRQVEGLLLFGLVLTALPLCAQTAAEPAVKLAPNEENIFLDPVRVTADLWESPLARIPASVTVYDEAALRSGAVRHFGDLVDQIPNLTWTGGTSRPRYLQIRGIGENSQFEGETPDSAVRFLVDDFDFTGLGTIGSAFDVRRSRCCAARRPGPSAPTPRAASCASSPPRPRRSGPAAPRPASASDSLRTGGFRRRRPAGGRQTGTADDARRRAADATTTASAATSRSMRTPTPATNSLRACA
jgi:hypothetical protein